MYYYKTVSRNMAFDFDDFKDLNQMLLLLRKRRNTTLFKAGE